MGSSVPVPPLAPDELVSAAGERQVLEAFLDLYRDIVKRKLTGLSDQQIRQRHVRSQTTLGGLVKHLAAVGRIGFLVDWFRACRRFASLASGVTSASCQTR
jgi:hypothetical protein